MADVPRQTVDEIAAGLDADRDDVERGLKWALAKYETYLEIASTDTMPTAAQLHASAAEVAQRLEEVARRIVDDPPHLGTMLGHYMGEELDRDATDAFRDFADPLMTLLKAACRARDAFESDKLTVTYGDGTEREHRRRTTTDARDRVLIPCLVGILRLIGLDLRDDSKGPWDHDAVECACGVVRRVLESQGISVPADGDWEKGEAQQGRLRRMVKAAWSSVGDPLTNITPISDQ